MVKRYFNFGVLFFCFVMCGSLLHAMEKDEEILSIFNDVFGKQSTRQEYTSASPDLLKQVKMSYKNGSLYLFDTGDQTLTIHPLNNLEIKEPINFLPNTASIYPVNNGRGILFKAGSKEKRSLCILDLDNNETIKLDQKKHKAQKLSYIEQSSHGDVLKEDCAYFFKAEAFDKRGRPCALDDKKMRTSRTQLFSFDLKEKKTKEIWSIPIFSKAVYRENDDSYILIELTKSGREAKFSKFIPSSSACIPFLTLNKYICNYELQGESIIPCKDSLAFLSPEKNKKGNFSPFLCQEKTCAPLLTEEEMEKLNADVTTFIPDFQGKLIAYGEDRLRLEWKVAQNLQEEYGSLSSLLNELQKERDCNLYFTTGSPDTHMIFLTTGQFFKI